MKNDVHLYTAKRRVNINDVSEALGLSKSTVSRALNNYPDIAKTTKNKVKKMADKLGYRPLLQAQSINKGLSYSLGLILNTEHTDHHKAFLSDFIDGISGALSSENWSLVVATVHDEQQEYQFMQDFIQMRKVDGFIIPRVRFNDSRVQLMKTYNIPYVLFGRPIDYPQDTSPYFDIAGENAIAMAVQKLYGLGHQHIAFMGGDSQCTYSTLRLNGYKQALKSCGLAYNAHFVCTDCCTPQSGYKNAIQLFVNNPYPPTAIVCALDRSAFGVYKFAKKYKLQIGSDISVIGYDGISEGMYITPKLTTFVVDRKYSGTRLASILLDSIKNKKITPVQEICDAMFQDRGSCAPPLRSSSEIAHIIKHARV